MHLYVMAIVALGAFLFGAVYPATYWPLLALGFLGGAWMLRFASLRTFRHQIFGAGLLVAPVLIQLIPLPHAALETVGPATARLLPTFDLDYVGRSVPWHPISLRPELTVTALLFLVVNIIWIAGVSSLVRNKHVLERLVTLSVGLGVVMALFGLAQKATFNGKIYWFWESPFQVSSNYFGPFVNRNHFAGWMLLAISLCTGYLMGQLATIVGPKRRSLRERVLWFGSPQLSRIISTAAALCIMAISVVWTLSRSGVAATTCALCLLAVASLLKMPTRAARRVAISLCVVGTIGLAAVWKGADVVTASYQDTRTLEWRLELWRDSITPLQAFKIGGSGLNTYGVVTLLYPFTDTRTHAQQAHNDYLQLAIEGGLLVCLPALIAICLAAGVVAKRLREPQDELVWWIRMGAITGVCGMGVQELTDFSLQIPGVALFFSVLIAIAIHNADSGNGRRRADLPVPASTLTWGTTTSDK